MLTHTDSDLDKLFNGNTENELSNNEFTPLIPAQLKAKRSVLVFRVDNHIHKNNEEEIKDEIQTHNDWVQGVTQVIKFPNSQIIKLTFSMTKEATKAKETGIKMFSMRIPPQNIQLDKYYNLTTCLTCYKVEDHITRQCQNPITTRCARSAAPQNTGGMTAPRHKRNA